MKAIELAKEDLSGALEMRRLATSVLRDASLPIVRSLGDSAILAQCGDVSINDLSTAESCRLKHLLREPISRLYPGGIAWLDRRVEDALNLQAHIRVASTPAHLVGASISSPKSEGVEKLSTLWVHPEFRRTQIGRLLVADVADQWSNRGVHFAYVTAAVGLAPAIQRVVEPIGLQWTHTEIDRYGIGRHEAIIQGNVQYPWSSEMSATAAAV